MESPPQAPIPPTTGATIGGDGQSSDNVMQKEAELKEMQDQIESYSQMVKQLIIQREMAVRRLAEMDTQIAELNRRLEVEKLQVESKENELKTKRTTLQKLKNEEMELKENFNQYEQQISATKQDLTNSRFNETQAKNKLTELQEFLKTTNEAVEDIRKAISVKDTIKLSALCNQLITPPNLTINSPKQQLASGNNNSNFMVLSNNSNKQQIDFDDLGYDPFKDQDPFEGDDPFEQAVKEVPALPEDDPFNPSSTSHTLSQYDPFAPAPQKF